MLHLAPGGGADVELARRTSSRPAATTAAVAVGELLRQLWVGRAGREIPSGTRVGAGIAQLLVPDCRGGVTSVKGSRISRIPN
jgi:hypothetical protein